MPTIQCPSCSQKYQVDASHQGKVVQCQKCSRKLQIPMFRQSTAPITTAAPIASVAPAAPKPAPTITPQPQRQSASQQPATPEPDPFYDLQLPDESTDEPDPFGSLPDTESSTNGPLSSPRSRKKKLRGRTKVSSPSSGMSAGMPGFELDIMGRLRALGFFVGFIILMVFTEWDMRTNYDHSFYIAAVVFGPVAMLLNFVGIFYPAVTRPAKMKAAPAMIRLALGGLGVVAIILGLCLERHYSNGGCFFIPASVL